jgi:hypothetical protein
MIFLNKNLLFLALFIIKYMESNRYRWLPKVQMVTNVTNGKYLAIGKHIAVHSLKATNGTFG